MPKARIYTNDFNRLIAATKDFISKDEAAKIAHQYIRLDFSAKDSKVTAVAVDGFRLSVENSVISDCDADFTVYVKPNVKLPAKIYAFISLESDGTALIRCNGFVFGYDQPEPSEFDWEKAIPQGALSLKIAFNGNYLLSALQAAKVSSGNSFKNPVVLEFRGPLAPVILRTNQEDIKMVLPIRITNQ